MNTSTIKKLTKYCGLFFIIVILSKLVFALDQQVIEIGKIKIVAVAIHSVELILAVFICYKALKFFRITKPVNLFLVVYVAAGFFIINSLLYIVFYALNLGENGTSFVNVYLGSRVALIAMLISLGAMFYYLDKQMRKIH